MTTVSNPSHRAAVEWRDYGCGINEHRPEQLMDWYDQAGFLNGGVVESRVTFADGFRYAVDDPAARVWNCWFRWSNPMPRRVPATISAAVGTEQSSLRLQLAALLDISAIRRRQWGAASGSPSPGQVFVSSEGLDGQLATDHPDPELDRGIAAVVATLRGRLDPFIGRKLHAFALAPRLHDLTVTAEPYQLIASAAEPDTLRRWAVKLDIALSATVAVQPARQLRDRILDYLARPDILTYSLLFTVTAAPPPASHHDTNRTAAARGCPEPGLAGLTTANVPAPALC